ncbi:protein phosphatase, Mg2+/Mn2+ dependent, 1Lb [Gadus chalcogrammus]|uniref:protein phosphatase, Mg2+/Mn2+ dependent, 1Lb n=1 Tax=Gadus chalcogrammus TaxID=1042646 RepID=UPI0024C4C1CA|nr:protein phosphatase, Mg2+/Mn2+ dependent, 1Lb [Gadus chalcogrammus]
MAAADVQQSVIERQSPNRLELPGLPRPCSEPDRGFISFNGSWRVQGILAMSRSLGDYPLKHLNVVIPDPDIMTFDLDQQQPGFMILASDGLWDAFSNEEAVRFIRERLDEPHFGAKSLVLQSFYRGCPDNITVMVVKFKGRAPDK